jgi:Holliday junction resolvase RusA-like endonuclease
MHPITILFNQPPKGKMGTRKSRTGVMYKDKSQVAYERAFQAAAEAAMKQRNLEPLEGPIETVIRAYHPIPVSWPKYRRRLAISGELRPVTKPDIDNTEKTINDSLKGIVFCDDNQIVETKRSKMYALEGRIEVEIHKWRVK